MQIIGLTGGIATGKSSVSQMIREMGIPVVCADELARNALHKGTQGYTEAVARFGKAILATDGEIDRKKLGSLVFADPQKKKTLEKIVHPLVISQMGVEINRLKKEGCAKIVLDIPLLYEAKLEKLCNKVILIYAPPAIQKERIKKRDGLEDAEIENRLKAQMLIEEKKKRADFVIDNSGPLKKTRQALKNVLKLFS